jgi:two-component system osmolarity sensor histidine kinase EnvZ
LEILIDDNGPGIPAPLHEEAFRPFRRLVERVEELPGTGLGLSVARSFARSLGGDVTLQNRIGGGLRVSLRVPV